MATLDSEENPDHKDLRDNRDLKDLQDSGERTGHLDPEVNLDKLVRNILYIFMTETLPVFCFW